MKLNWIIILFIPFAILGCSSNNHKDGTKRIAIVISTLNNPWFVYLGEKAQEKAQSLGYEAKLFDSQNNAALESDHFDNIIVGGFDAILFNPTDSDGSIANVLKAKAAGVPVFCMDREINSEDAATSQILSDSYSGAVSIGEYFVRELGKSGKYVEILGMVGDNNTWARSNGFHSVVDHYTDLELVAQQSADFDRNKAMEVMESILQAHPDVKGVFCGNDAMAMGAYQAVLSSNKAGKIKIFGFDGAADVINAIKQEKISATGMQFPKTIAYTAAEFADSFLKGKRDFPQKVPVGVELVTQDNISDYMAFGSK